MKHLLTILCAVMLGLTLTTSAQNQALKANKNATRSEQFILDSLNNELEMMRLNQQYEMYQDSLDIVLKREHSKYSTYEEVAQLSIPLIFFGAIILIVWISLNTSYRKKKEQYRILELAIEKGCELPENFFDEATKKRHSWINTLRNGVATLGCGIGILLLGHFTEEEVITGIAFIPVFIGLGYLLVALLEYREEKHHNKQDQQGIEKIESTEDSCSE